MAKCNLGKVKLQANVVSSLLLMRTWSEGCPQGPFAYLVTYIASHAGIFELIFTDLLLSKSLRVAMDTSLALASLAWGIQAPVQPLRHQFPSSSIGDGFKGNIVMSDLSSPFSSQKVKHLL